MSLDKLAIAVEGKEMAVLEGMDVNGKSDVSKDGKSINTQLDYTLKSLKVQNQDLGTGKLSLKIGNIDGQAWHEFSQKYSKESQALLTDAALQQNPEVYQQQAMAVLFNNLPILLKGEPVITVAPLSWKNSKGETSFNLSLFLKDPATATGEPQTLAQEVDRSVKSLDSKLTIPMDMATEFMTQIAKLEGYGDEDAGKLANQQVKGLAAMGQMFRITKVENNTISTSLQYANGQVTLNGDKMPLEDFVGMFGMPRWGCRNRLNRHRPNRRHRSSKRQNPSHEGFFYCPADFSLPAYESSRSVHFLWLLRLRQMATLINPLRPQVLRHFGPDAFHIEKLADRMKIITPQRHYRAGDFHLSVSHILRHILCVGAIVSHCATHGTRRLIRPNIGIKRLGADGRRIVGPVREKVAQPDMLPTRNQRFRQVWHKMKQEEPVRTRNRRIQIARHNTLARYPSPPVDPPAQGNLLQTASRRARRDRAPPAPLSVNPGRISSRMSRAMLRLS
jgi:hypothetical protein